jgi:hypothetical protein
MRLPWIWAILLGVGALAFAFPAAMLSPGPLLPEHESLTDDCFACHAPLRGVAAGRCIVCHPLAEIGGPDPGGAPGERGDRPTIGASFHLELIEQRCVSCHSEHGRRLARRFSHESIRPSVREACVNCHAAPADLLHRSLPADCGQCHTTEHWSPATFAHDGFFVLGRHHVAPCEVCHVEGDVARYTCFGCHEHTPENVRDEHEEEGIGPLDDCVRCHHDPDGEGDDE